MVGWVICFSCLWNKLLLQRWIAMKYSKHEHQKSVDILDRFFQLYSWLQSHVHVQGLLIFFSYSSSFCREILGLVFLCANPSQKFTC